MSVNAIADQLTGKAYGLVFLALATTAYVDPKSGRNIGEQYQQALGSLPAVPGDNGSNAGFDLGWGPAYNADYSNLMYVTVYSSGSQPQFAVVGIRGTDIAVADKLGLLKQILEDIDVKHTVPATEINAKATAGAAVAKGSYDGLQTLIGLQSQALELPRTGYTPPSTKQISALEYLQMMVGEQGKYPNLPIVVTGHSLGGCQTTVFAAWLAGQMQGATVIPHPFAPPTAGNGDFANWYEMMFAGSGIAWINPLDIVPAAFADLEAIKTQLWGAYSWPAAGANAKGPAMPSDLYPEFDRVQKDAAPNGYTQLTGNDVVVLKQVMPTEAEVKEILTSMNMDTSKWQTWLAQLIWQHFPPAYYNLIEQVGGVLQPYPMMLPSHF